MEILFGYLAGLLTLINPCVLPVLPIVLATSLQASKWGPVALAAGMSGTFVVLGLGVAAFSYTLNISEEAVNAGAAVLMVAFGFVLVIPRFSEAFATATGGFASSADAQLDTIDRSSLSGQIIGGALLGAVWSPCIGPTLGVAINYASTGENIGVATAIMLAFAAGVSTIIIALGYGTRAAIMSRQALMRKVAVWSRPVMGWTFIVVGVALLLGVHHMLEELAIQYLPAWFNDLSVSI